MSVRLIDQLAEANRRVLAGKVTPDYDAAAFAAALHAFDFIAPADLEEVIDWIIGAMETGLVHMNHPRYLGLFNPAPSFPAQCADQIAAAFNPQLASSASSPVAVAIEAHVVQALAAQAGLGLNAAGHFTSGGSEANFTALICALTRADMGFALKGSRVFAGQPTIYVSQDSHVAWVKNAHEAGIGRDAVRMIQTDGAGRMSLDTLAATIKADQAIGLVPVMVVATAGTTNAGMVDPLAACAAIAAAEGLWFHVDAAWGGALVVSAYRKPMIAGIELADSVTIDAHKWLAATMGCGVFLTIRAEILESAFNVSARFMPSEVGCLDPYLTSVQWSRRFVGLRLFLALASAGWEGYSAHVEQSFTRLEQLVAGLRTYGWKLANADALAVACLYPPPGSPAPREIVENLLASGNAWVSCCMFEGKQVIRACITHGETSEANIVQVINALEAARRA